MKVTCKIKDENGKVVKEATTEVALGEKSLDEAVKLVGAEVIHYLYLKAAKLQALARMRGAMTPTDKSPGKTPAEVVELMKNFKPAKGVIKATPVEKLRQQIAKGMSKDDLATLLKDIKAQLG